MGRPYRRVGLVGPICLIALGVILLLNNLGILSSSIWIELLQIWPVLLIAIGIDLLVGRRSAWGTILAFLLIVALIGGSVWLVAMERPARPPSSSEIIAQPLGEASLAQIALIPEIGTVRVQSFSSPSLLFEATIYPLAGEQIVHSFALQGQTEMGTVRSAGLSVGPVGQAAPAYTWDVLLNDRLPTALQIQFGIGQVQLHLTSLTLTGLDLSAGVGQFVVDLPNHGQLSGRVVGAIGQMIVTIPPGMEARLHVTTALAGRSISSRFRQEGDYFVSPGYAGAKDRADLDLSLAVGDLIVR